ncbi:retrotransposon protein [Cucumis melo var. makuwa]|uniref:Retrotransposon protein n=1 Tax=Cucumis melo var. makuwa TaxID=1194695 RepID=A0A5A7VL62_CUCMM|nr:retrotransposon protein [Cucumis melo var. makuwa]TYJ99838.1 retrotransposon protein [Cucumis melo var. makuwa]
MQGPSNNGFGWNNELKCTVAKKDEFDNWVKNHPAAKDLLNRSFPHYNNLSYIFRRACDERALGDICRCGSNVPFGYEGIATGDGNNMKIPTMFSQGLNMSREEFVAINLSCQVMVGMLQAGQRGRGMVSLQRLLT